MARRLLPIDRRLHQVVSDELVRVSSGVRQVAGHLGPLHVHGRIKAKPAQVRVACRKRRWQSSMRAEVFKRKLLGSRSPIGSMCLEKQEWRSTISARTCLWYWKQNGLANLHRQTPGPKPGRLHFGTAKASR
eukprot:1158421-Pelagomonas_calceolata.AAC.9